MSPVTCCNCSFHSRRTTSKNYNMFFCLRLWKIDFRRNKFLMVIPRIYRTAYIPVIRRNMITVRASETRNNIFRMSFHCFLRPVWIRKKRSSKSHHIYITFGNDFICHGRCHHRTDNRHRNLYLSLCLFCPFQIRHFFFKICCNTMDICLKNLVNTRRNLNRINIRFRFL